RPPRGAHGAHRARCADRPGRTRGPVGPLALERAPFPGGRVITTIVLIKCDPKSIPQAALKLAGVNGVSEGYSVSGEWDLVAMVRVKEYDEIAHVVTEEFAAVPGIERTQTLTAFRAYSKKDLEQAWDLGEK